MRGDHDGRKLTNNALDGSPPRAWGSPGYAATAAVPVRSTPTCVGITRWPAWSASPRPVHPHVRGDHYTTAFRLTLITGSPPRAWGSRVRILPILSRLRFTPTCVGITRKSPQSCGPATVHPHVRGDHEKELLKEHGADGSPPRAWGSHWAWAEPNHACRFTPTCVGITSTAWASASASSVHPHVRGDHFSTAKIEKPLSGSPPRAWGSLQEARSPERVIRFTPTCVGITSEWRIVYLPSAVHPHVRGDHAPVFACFGPMDGSPPRAWGSRAR